MSSKKILKQIKDKAERQILQKLIEKYNLHEFNIQIAKGRVDGLSIKFKNLTKIPEEIGKFIDLRELDLSRNQIENIEGLTELISLRKLTFRENRIQKIDGLVSLIQLNELDLSDNQIETIEGIFNLRKLETLELSRNRIKKLEGLKRNLKLKILKLNGNPIEKIEGLEKLTKLQTLLLARSHIKKIEGLDKLINLKELNLALNQIKKIENLDKNVILRYLNLNDNQIQHIEKISHLTLLQELMLERNELNPLDQSFVSKPARIIVGFCKKKYEDKKKNREFRQEIKQKRDVYQIEEELSWDTEVQTPQATKKMRDKMVNNSQIPNSNTNGNSPNQMKASQFNPLPTPRPDPIPSPNSNPLPTPRPDPIPGPQSNPLPTPQANSLPTPQANSLPVPQANPLPTPQTDSAAKNSTYAEATVPTVVEKPKVVPVPNPQIIPVLNNKFQTEDEWMKFADELSKMEDYTNALVAYRNVLQLNTLNFDAWIHSGIAFNNKGDYRRSIRAFKQALASFGKNAQLWMYMGIGFYNIGDFEQAVGAFNESLLIDSNNSVVNQYLDQIPEEYKRELNLMGKQAEVLAQHAQQVDDQLLQQLQQYSKAYQEITFKELLPYVYNAPYITDIASLRHKITDLVLQNRINIRLFLDHAEFGQEIAETPEIETKREVVKIAEDYKVIKLLAFTNFSKLWLAESPDNGEKIVLKHIIYRDDLHYRTLTEQMALREIALLTKIKSSHVISLMDSFLGEYQNDWGYILKLPYYKFGTLDKKIKQIEDQYKQTGNLMDPRAIIVILTGLLEGIIAIHEAGIVHRDIKPSNIILNTNSVLPKIDDVIIIDFGIATAPLEITGTDFTIAGGCGTRGFSAPEQLESPHVNFNADIYAVGATIYYALTLTRYGGQFYLPDYANRYYQGINFIFPLLQQFLDNDSSKRCSGIEELNTIVTKLKEIVGKFK
jgi:tetratricopeptide (TPR) repeat protein